MTGTTNPQTFNNLAAPASVTASFVATATCGNATTLSTTAITFKSATLSWAAPTHPVQWQVQYKTTNLGAKWVDVFVDGNALSTILTSLKANQSYIWHIRAKCGKVWTTYSSSVSFKTVSSTLSISNALTSTTEKPIGEKEGLHITAQPNPSTTYFTLHIQSSNNSVVRLNVIDAVGRTREGRTGIAANSTLRIGYGYRPGVYYAQVLQGDKMVTIKLIKQ